MSVLVWNVRANTSKITLNSHHLHESILHCSHTVHKVSTFYRTLQHLSTCNFCVVVFFLISDAILFYPGESLQENELPNYKYTASQTTSKSFDWVSLRAVLISVTGSERINHRQTPQRKHLGSRIIHHSRRRRKNVFKDVFHRYASTSCFPEVHGCSWVLRENVGSRCKLSVVYMHPGKTLSSPLPGYGTPCTRRTIKVPGWGRVFSPGI